MTNTQSLSLPMILPTGPDCARCVDRLRAELSGIKGVERAEVDAQAGAITVVYDPDSVTLSRIESEARKAGAGLASRIEHRTIELRDLDCPDCAATIEKAVNQIPGVLWAGANFAAGQMHAEYERGKVSLREIARVVEQHGARACPLPDSVPGTEPAPSVSIWSEHRKLIVTSAATVLTAAALIAGRGGGMLSTALYAAAIVIGGWSTAKAALAALRTRTVDMNGLMTIAVIGAAGIGEWFEGATVVVLYNIGGLLQAYTVERTRRSIRSLMDFSPKAAWVRRAGIEFNIPVEKVQVGETVLVKPGERIPIDGEISLGLSAINESAITGESMPVEKGPGDAVFAGTLNGQGALEFTATHRFRDTTLARIIHKVEEAQAQRAPAQQFIDRFAAVYTPAVVGLAVLVALVPPFFVTLSGTNAAGISAVWSDWFLRALSLLIISCPCALVISTPVAIVTAIGAASRRGALIKGGVYLEELGRVRAVLFDKTGTLTTGRFSLEEAIPLADYSANEIIMVAAAIEARSSHPLAEAFANAVVEGPLPPAESVEETPGRGIRGVIGGQLYLIGNELFMRENGIALDSGLLQREDGRTPIFLAANNSPLGLFFVADSIRADSLGTVDALRSLGIERQEMLTGDREAVGRRVASAAGLDAYRTGLLPDQKREYVVALKKELGSVAMVGDGVNDAPALAASNVGIAMGAAASDTALETADVAILGEDLDRLTFLVRLSRRTRAIIQQNVAVSLATKGMLIVAALTVGLPLWLAVLGDVGVSLLVTINGLRLLENGK